MVLQNAFLCCELRTGGIVIGWLYGIIAFLNVIMYVTLSVEWRKMEMTTLFLVLAIISLLHVSSSILLIVGIIKKTRELYVPWLILCGIILIPLSPFAFIMAIIVFPFVFPFYAFYCIYSLYYATNFDDSRNDDSRNIGNIENEACTTSSLSSAPPVCFEYLPKYNEI